MGVLWQWIIFGLLAASPAYADGISGTYIGKGSNSAFLVQIVETTGGQLTGRYEQTVLQPSGKLDRMIAAITGASDGHTVAVTLKPTELMSGNISASGTLEGSLLHLSGGNSGSNVDLNLAKADEAAYKTEVEDLTAQGRAIIEAQAMADQLAHLNDLANRMIASSVDADAQLGKFAPIEQRYRTITQLMNAALMRQQSIYGSGQAYVARGQVGVAINQSGVEAEQLHISLQSADQDIGSKLQSLAKDAVDASSICRSANLGKNDALRDTCTKFQEAGVKFKASILALSQAFNHAEKIWAEEYRKQQTIVKASDVATR
jgi:hypothetical protein